MISFEHVTVNQEYFLYSKFFLRLELTLISPGRILTQTFRIEYNM